MDDDPAVAAPNRDAVRSAAGDEADQAVAIGPAGGAGQFGGVEVGQAHLDPRGRVGGVAYAQTVAVADMAHHPREGCCQSDASWSRVSGRCQRHL